LAELLQLLTPANQRQGKPCHPLSEFRLPQRLFDKTQARDYETRQDDEWNIHIRKIFEVTGSLSEHQIDSIVTSEQIKAKIRQFERFLPQNFEERFDPAPAAAARLLQSMLQFLAGALISRIFFIIHLHFFEVYFSMFTIISMSNFVSLSDSTLPQRTALACTMRSGTSSTVLRIPPRHTPAFRRKRLP
jgi:hypothetical protein